ncbi:cadherin-87A [Daktulosphaira vitifoliae]|uniref:cadherin-87A n=1 Tax=Daktulosphaira vitifoliae TaxID=58002 RepID=UPI0021AAE578|nr:cadherin-87A [Daktulosphaira vitifoliae]
MSSSSVTNVGYFQNSDAPIQLIIYLPTFINYMQNEALSENILVGQQIYTLLGINSLGSSDDLIYGIEGTDKFAVDSKSGIVTLAKPLDHEENNALTFSITLKQQNSGDIVRIQTTVIVLDENDNAPTFKNLPYEGTVSEESKIGLTVFKWIQVEDLDQVGQPLEVRCESSSPNDGCLKFKIVSENISESYYSGALVVNEKIKYSENQFYQLTIIAHDGSHVSKTTLDIHVKDIQNMPPVFHGSLTSVISEDIAVGTHVLTVNAKDGDRGEPRGIVYDLIQNPMDYFSLDKQSGELTTAKLIDRETLMNNNGIITLTVKAQEILNDIPIDDNISSTSAIITITVQDVNDEPPKFNKLNYFVSVPENIAPGTPLPNLNMTVSDSDIGTNSEFSLSLLDESNYFVIDPPKAIGATDVSIKLAKNIKLDYEDPNQRKFIVLVKASETSEKYNLSSTATLVIQVTDINDNYPVFDNNVYTFTINETAAPGTIIGIVKASDRDSNSFIVYSLTGPSAEKFYVDKLTGTISVALCSDVGKAMCLDYETQSNYYLTFIATDDNSNGQSSSVPIMITLSDNNDNAPVFMQHLYTSLVDEGAVYFEPSLIVQATDADKSSLITYSISGYGSELFKIDSSSGEIFIASPNGLKRLENDNITLSVIANDGIYSDEAIVNIMVLDINNNSPKFLSDMYNVSIYENVPISYSVIKVEAKDNDINLNANLTYSILEGSFNHFSIDELTGVIYVSSKLNYDQHSNYVIKALAIDKGTPALTGSTTITVNIININNRNPEFIPVIQRTEVSEDVPVGTVIYRLNAQDADISDVNALSFSLNSSLITGITSKGNQLEDNSVVKEWFKVRPSNGDVIVAKSIDRNIAAVVSLSVIVTDTSAPDVQQSSGTLMINIMDINDIAPKFDKPWTKENPILKLSTFEEQPIGTIIGNFAAHDDTGIDYYAVLPVNQYIDVNQSTGSLYIKKKIDFENIETISITLIAYDTGYPQLSSSAIISIQILDVNDNYPIFNQTEYKAEIDENSPPGTFVTKVFATDADKSTFGLVHYSIVGHSYGLYINQDTGTIKVHNSTYLNREEIQEITLRIHANDEAPPELSKSAIVLLTVKLRDINDNPPQFDPKEYYLSIIDSNPNTPLMQLKAIDKDINSKLVYTIVSGNKDLFNLDKETGFLYPTLLLNGVSGIQIVEIDVFDGIFRDCASINVTILDINQNQPIFVHPLNSTLLIPENISVGTLVLTVCAEDKDLGENGRVTYFFKEENNNIIQTDTFTINPETGQIKTQILLDYETKSSYELVLVARDQGSPLWQESLKVLNINLIDVNDNRPHFSVPNGHKPLYTFKIKENNRPQHKIGQVKATDLDHGENAHIFYHLLTPNHIPFMIDRLDGTIYANDTLDREEQSSYEIVVKASNDNIEYQHTNDIELDDYSLAKVLIIVTDENDNTPIFQSNHYYAGVNSMGKVGDVILQVVVNDPDSEENNAVSYNIEHTQLYKPGIENITWFSTLKDPFTIDSMGRISTAVFLAEYNQGRFLLQIAAKETVAPFRTTTTIASVWVYEVQQLVKLIVSRAPQTVNEGRESILLNLANVTNMIVVLDDVRYHVNQYGYIQPDSSDVYIHMVNPSKNSIMSSGEVLSIIDDKYDYLKDYYEHFAIENVVPVLFATQSDSFEPTIAALVALIVVLSVGCIGVLIICCCFRHWMFSSELDNNSIKNDILIKKSVIDDLSTTENPLWIEQKLKLYEEQELTMQVFCDIENKDLPNNQDSMGDNTYATIRRPSRRGSINTLLTMTTGEYATLGGSVLPLPLDGATSHSQQMFEASLGFQGSTFQVPDLTLDTSNLLRSNSDI